ncbi:MAG: dipeptide/tripeptide permease [Polaribacter sp.]|jgi:dipeptide/tripeptide permease
MNWTSRNLVFLIFGFYCLSDLNKAKVSLSLIRVDNKESFSNISELILENKVRKIDLRKNITKRDQRLVENYYNRGADESSLNTSLRSTFQIYMYGWFTASMVFSQMIGALLGDLLIGNKKALVIGGIIQSLGAFCLCIPSTTGFYVGLFLFVFGAISLGILLLIPDTPNEQHAFLYLISLFFLGVSEIHIGPIVHSILTQYANPKYLAILVSMVFIPTRLFSYLLALLSEQLYDKPTITLLIAMIVMTVLSIVLILYNRKNGMTYSRKSTNQS